MAITATPASAPVISAMPSPKQQFLNAYGKGTWHDDARLGRVSTRQDQPAAHPKCKTARELAWIFVLERGLGTMVFSNAFAAGMPAGKMPDAPESWDAILAAFEKAHKDFGELVRSTPDEKLFEHVKFFTAPKTLGDVTRLEFAWFLLCDEIHHRGQFSIYLRMADAKVPSIYGPSADEPWM